MNHSSCIEVLEVTDENDMANADRRRAQFDRNSAWLQKNISSVYANNRGQCICVAGQEAFAADTAAEAITMATAAHPDEEGWFTRYIPLEKVPRVYAI